MAASNCWEFLHCGREHGGDRVEEMGICPAVDAHEFDGVNGGHSGGRFCWVITGTLCNNDVQGTFGEKALNCMECQFYAHVVRGQEQDLILNPSQLE